MNKCPCEFCNPAKRRTSEICKGMQNVNYKQRDTYYSSKFNEYENQKNHKSILSEHCRQEFFKTTDKKGSLLEMEKYKNLTNQSYDNKMFARKQQLLSQIKSDTVIMESQLLNKNKTETEMILAQQNQKLLDLKKKRELQREKVVKQRQIQQLVANSEEIRPYLRQKLLEESKRTQLHQIEEKLEQRKMDELNERMWLDVQQRTLQQKESNAILETKFRNQVEQFNALELKRQIEEQKQFEKSQKQLAIEERKRSQCLLAEVKAEEDRLIEQKRLAKTKIADDLKEQLQVQENYKRIKQQKDADFMDMFHKSILAEIRKDKEITTEASSELKKQIENFLEYKNQLKNQMEMEERERNTVIRKNFLQSECEQYKVKEKMNIQRKKAAETTNAEVHQQILERSKQKNIENRNEHKAAVEERKKVSVLLDQDKKQEHEKKMASLDYGKELLQQVEEVRMRQRYERQREKELIGDYEKEQQDSDERINHFILKGEDILPPHPNYKKIMKSF